ncbi:tubulin epsilon and delta complex protein 1 [Paramormyrops kingsleyae]|uniref:Tubulin epsilon and delta complex 1 n=1 Tax=Paramormyrops kingsleyae TaxID=1676925 RepID=A0A3B3SU14_9TELE|nr:uncharacterized protein C14orf80 homolog [Paramormyrops kingsleyae]
MQRDKSLKVKEVIESLCKLLCALGVQSVPGAETFRRAKFNKPDAVPEMWQLLYSIYVKAFAVDCEFQVPHKPDLGAQVSLVRSMLVHYGYGAQWLRGDRSQWDAVGSRDLLLALGWLLSTGSLLESLLWTAAQGPDVLPGVTRMSFTVPSSFDAPVTPKGEEEPPLGAEEWERALRRLQWQHGKLTFMRRSLLAAQEERARLLHQVLHSTRCTGDSQHRDAKTHLSTAVAGRNKELERLQIGTRVLERYLDWKLLEGLFWSWMGSVIDAQLADPPLSVPEEAAATEPKTLASGGGRRQVRGHKGDVERLSATLRSLLSEIRGMWAEPGSRAPSRERLWDAAGVPHLEQAEIQGRVRARLKDLAEAFAPTKLTRSYRPRLREPPRSKPDTRSCGALASELIGELREKEAALLRELGRLRRGEREEIVEQASKLEGVVLIPPPKR